MFARHVCMVLAICAGILAVSAGAARGQVAREYSIKAAFLYNLAKFTEWPKGTDGGAFSVCVVGEDPFGQDLDTIAATKTVGDQTLAVHRFRSPEHITACRILFVSRSEAHRLDAILARTGRSATLLVGDTEGFAENGIMINFYVDQDKIRFEINETAVTEANLKISSKLLRIARIVGADKEGR